jgi:hypothetical protein
MAFLAECKHIKEGERLDVIQTPRSLCLSTVGIERGPDEEGRVNETVTGLMKDMCSVLQGLNGRKLIWDQRKQASIAFCRITGLSDHTLRSSANRRDFDPGGITEGRLLMNIKNRVGPRTDP